MNKQNTITQQHYLKLHANGIIRLTILSEVIYLKSDGNYTDIILKDLSQYIMCKTLIDFETELGPLFFRCHKSYLINMIYIKEINKRNRHILLTTGKHIPFSRNKAKILEERMGEKPC